MGETVQAAVVDVVNAAVDGAPSPVHRRDGRTVRWAEHRATRRAELVDAAITAVRRYGAAVGMDQIAAVARTSKPVIYRYFADKNELYRAVGERVAADLLRDLSDAARSVPDVRARIGAGIDAYLRMLEQSPELYRFVVDGGDRDGTDDDVSAGVAALLRGELAGLLRGAGLDPTRAEPWGTAMVGFVRAAGQWWLAHPGAMTRAELAESLTSLLWTGASGLATTTGAESRHT